VLWRRTGGVPRGIAKDKDKKSDGTAGQKEGKEKKTKSKRAEAPEGGRDDAKKFKSKKSSKSKSSITQRFHTKTSAS